MSGISSGNFDCCTAKLSLSDRDAETNSTPWEDNFFAARRETFSVAPKYISKAWKYISEPLKYISKPLKKFYGEGRRLLQRTKKIFVACRNMFCYLQERNPRPAETVLSTQF